MGEREIIEIYDPDNSLRKSVRVRFGNFRKYHTENKIIPKILCWTVSDKYTRI